MKIVYAIQPTDKMKIGILLISTGKYKQFVRPLLDSLEKHFLKDKKLIIYLFTDEMLEVQFERLEIIQTLIPSYKFPQATLYRYKIFTSLKYPDCKYLFYMDVDMKVVADIGDEILEDIVAVRHPGFDKMGGGSWETRPESACYTEKKKSYYAGGVQGGSRVYYYLAMMVMRAFIEIDERNGIVPIWHDESAWNCYLSKLDNFKELESSYCMVEQMDLRRRWKIDLLQPKIIALEKDHQKIRE